MIKDAESMGVGLGCANDIAKSRNDDSLAESAIALNKSLKLRYRVYDGDNARYKNACIFV